MGHSYPYGAKRVPALFGFNTLVSAATGKTLAEWPHGSAFATMLTSTKSAFELVLMKEGGKHMKSYCGNSSSWRQQPEPSCGIRRRSAGCK